MSITDSEFKTNFDKYLELITRIQENIFITRNGKTIAKMSNPQISAVDSISGILSGYDIDKSSLREERFQKFESND